jgi:hypothetical protein
MRWVEAAGHERHAGNREDNKTDLRAEALKDVDRIAQTRNDSLKVPSLLNLGPTA